ncbi:beta-class carbonic anhydrase [Ferrimonas marina]|uniref:Carbonic anhydrase n=1 Tax=Ferrimonas marina TaxID=299255 RepID=A0A1M5YV53_9GAMM|nr:carbonic anhydrase [Ferrimonas marina]SHI15957.1 carbonic anhydrase [Ferrimonas marina]
MSKTQSQEATAPLESSTTVGEVLAANQEYQQQFGDKGALAMPPARRFAILTCMDARLDPAQFAGLAEGDAHVIRNAGGRASDDAIRSLVISYKLLGTKEWFIIHHTDCGMVTFDGPTMAGLLSRSLQPAEHNGEHWHCPADHSGTDEGHFVPWLTFDDPAQAVQDDIRRIRQSPMVPEEIALHGYVYDCGSGALIPVAAPE